MHPVWRAPDLEWQKFIGLNKKESIFMNIKMNNYLNQTSYTAAASERASESHVGGKIECETKSGTNRDTVIISVAGQQFFAE